jgi:hypothetical protein
MSKQTQPAAQPEEPPKLEFVFVNKDESWRIRKFTTEAQAAEAADKEGVAIAKSCQDGRTIYPKE